MIDSMLPGNRGVTAWLCLCPLLAVAATWQDALALAACLLATMTLTAGGLVFLRRGVQPALYLPLAALLAGTFAVLEHLALAAWSSALDASVAPWLLLVAGLTVLVCCSNESLRENRTLTPAPLPAGEGSEPATAREDFFRAGKWALSLSMTLLIIGVARDGFGRVFLLAETPVGALVLLALLLAVVNAMKAPLSRPSATLSPQAGRGNHSSRDVCA